MAKATLPTNFKDDILADAMGNKRRYNVIENSDGTISLEDATAYTQVGSTFGAAQINATNAAANASADASKIIDDYETLIANTQAGYMAGALAVKALNSNLGNVYYLGTGTSFNVKALLPNIDYTKLSTNNFIVEYSTLTTKLVNTDTNEKSTLNAGYSNSASGNLSKAYNANTGIINVSIPSPVTGTGWITSTASISNPKVYLIVGDIQNI